MFCGNCGTENDNGVKFCKACGLPLSNNENLNKKENTSNGTVAGQISNSQLIDKLKSLPKKTLAIAGTAVVALLLVIFIAVGASNSINLNKYLTIETEGFDGYGTARAVVDWDTIARKYGNKVKFNSEARKEFGEMLNAVEPIDAVEEWVSINLDTRQGLANGSKIKYTWNIDSDLARYLQCKIKFKDGEHKVSGLMEVDSFDAFADLEVSFVGIAPNSSVCIDYSGTEMNSYDFKCDKVRGFKNGDTIKITIDDYVIESIAQQFGKVPEEKEKTYTVSGLDENVEAFADLPEDFISQAKADAEDTIYSYTTKTYAKSSKVSDLTYAGYIMNHLKDTSSWGAYNNLFIIYSGMLSSTENKFQDTIIYYPVRFSNIVSSGGKVTYGEKSSVIGRSDLIGAQKYYTNGYTSAITCYLDIVDANKDLYDTEVGGGFEKYGKYETVSTLSEISDTFKESIKKDTEETIKTYIAENYNGGSHASELVFEGEYLLKAKNDDVKLQNKSIYFVVLSASVSNENGKFDATKVYFPVRYDGLVKLADKEFMVLGSSGIQGKSTFLNSIYSTKGYIDGEAMYSDIVTLNRENYKYEVSKGLQQFGN